jgi:hypothetical protein
MSLSSLLPYLRQRQRYPKAIHWRDTMLLRHTLLSNCCEINGSFWKILEAIHYVNSWRPFNRMPGGNLQKIARFGERERRAEVTQAKETNVLTQA